MPPPAVTLTSDLLTPISNQFVYEPEYICVQDWLKFPFTLYRFLRYCVPKDFASGRTDSRTDGHTRKQNASSIEGFQWRMHINKLRRLREGTARFKIRIIHTTLMSMTDRQVERRTETVACNVRHCNECKTKGKLFRKFCKPASCY